MNYFQPLDKIKLVVAKHLFPFEMALNLFVILSFEKNYYKFIESSFFLLKLNFSPSKIHQFQIEMIAIHFSVE